MKAKEMNILLLESFLELQAKFDEYTSWQEGIDTGCTITYADIFTPYIIECIEKYNEDKIKSIFDFVEKLASFNDEYANQVIMLSIFDPLFFYNDKFDCYKYCGKSTAHLLDIYKANSQIDS